MVDAEILKEYSGHIGACEFDAAFVEEYIQARLVVVSWMLNLLEIFFALFVLVCWMLICFKGISFSRFVVVR